MEYHIVECYCTCIRVSVQGVKSLGGHFACLCRGFEFYEVKKKKNLLLFFKKKIEILLLFFSCIHTRVSVQGVQSLGGHFACLCRGFDF